MQSADTHSSQALLPLPRPDRSIRGGQVMEQLTCVTPAAVNSTVAVPVLPPKSQVPVRVVPESVNFTCGGTDKGCAKRRKNKSRWIAKRRKKESEWIAKKEWVELDCKERKDLSWDGLQRDEWISRDGLQREELRSPGWGHVVVNETDD